MWRGLIGWDMRGELVRLHGVDLGFGVGLKLRIVHWNSGRCQGPSSDRCRSRCRYDLRRKGRGRFQDGVNVGKRNWWRKLEFYYALLV
jgi:hypothetical protein